MSAGNVDKFGNSAKLDTTRTTSYGSLVLINGKNSGGYLVDLYLEGGYWTGTNKLGNKYIYKNGWVYVGKGNVTANYAEFTTPVNPSSGSVLSANTKPAHSNTYTLQQTKDLTSVPQAQTAGFGGSITFGDQPTELLKYGAWIIGAVVAIVFFMRPRRKRR